MSLNTSVRLTVISVAMATVSSLQPQRAGPLLWAFCCGAGGGPGALAPTSARLWSQVEGEVEASGPSRPSLQGVEWPCCMNAQAGPCQLPDCRSEAWAPSHGPRNVQPCGSTGTGLTSGCGPGTLWPARGLPELQSPLGWALLFGRPLSRSRGAAGCGCACPACCCPESSSSTLARRASFRLLPHPRHGLAPGRPVSQVRG